MTRGFAADADRSAAAKERARRACGALCVAMLATLGAACEAPAQVPVARSVEVFTPSAELRLVERRPSGRGVAYVFESEADPGTRIRAVRLAGAAPRCRGGAALPLAVDAVPKAAGATVDIGGRHVIDATVPGSAAPPVAVDVEILRGGATSCVRVPVDGSLARWRRPRPALAVSAGADLMVPNRAVGWNAAELRLLASVGHYQGRIGAELSGGLVGAFCSRSACPPPRSGRSGGGGGFGLQLGGGFEAYPLDLGFTEVGLGARELTQVVHGDSPAAPSWLWVNGLEGVLRFSIWRRWWGGGRRRVEGRLPPNMITIDAPVGVWTTGFGRSRTTALVMGLGISIHKWNWDD